MYKYETDDKCYDQLGCNVAMKLVVTIRPMAVKTNFVITAVTMRLLVLAYFLSNS